MGILVDEEQLEKEKAYVVPTDSEIKSKYKMQRLEIRSKFDNSQVLLVNYVAEDYRFLLKKFLSVLSLVPPNLRAMIVPLPKNCAYVDQYYAKRI